MATIQVEWGEKMQLTKYAHACLSLEKPGAQIIIDPGNLTDDYTPRPGVVAIIVTHTHSDHFDPDMIDQIIQLNENAVVIAHQSVTDKLAAGVAYVSVESGDTLTVGGFSLKFYGGEHATIFDRLPGVANLGVMVDETLYYPGDSFAVPDMDVKFLALPVAAPWLKISETIDFLSRVRPKLAFPTHDAILSASGQQIVDNLLGQLAPSYEATYRRLDHTALDLDEKIINRLI
jgi:L-ascorbate metabolism protein UlaG (beta-lactamase superfamily)